MPCIRLLCGWLAYPGSVSILQRAARVPPGGKDVCSLLVVPARVGSNLTEDASIAGHNFRRTGVSKPILQCLLADEPRFRQRNFGGPWRN